jgi:hypothetical protein
MHPKITHKLIKILQQSLGFGLDSGIRNEVTQFSQEVLKFHVKNPVILDVGANIGIWSKLINSEIEQCIIHAFEPSKETFLVLEESTKNIPNLHIYNFSKKLLLTSHQDLYLVLQKLLKY